MAHDDGMSRLPLLAGRSACWRCSASCGPTGSLYLHIDRQRPGLRSSSLLDAIFGVENCRNEIIWHLQDRRREQALVQPQARHHPLLQQDPPNIRFSPQREKSYLSAQIWLQRISAGRKRCRRVIIGEVGDARCLGHPRPARQPAGSGLLTPRRSRSPSTSASSAPRARRAISCLDPFCGSGTTAIAAERLGRQLAGRWTSGTAQARCCASGLNRRGSRRA